MPIAPHTAAKVIYEMCRTESAAPSDTPGFGDVLEWMEEHRPKLFEAVKQIK